VVIKSNLVLDELAADWTSVGHEVVLIDRKFGATRLRFASLNQPIGVQTRQRNIIDEVWI
jgi:hypothetical protein|tara:strand:- start:345 stop:524 length:180 start_codon:yes stop_codon:yes gene_type:complete